MMASKLMEALQALIAEHGDQPMEDEYGRKMDVPEYNTDDGTCFCVSFYEL